jgi:cytochrome b6-f complex iron-sulfur subunit
MAIVPPAEKDAPRLPPQPADRAGQRQRSDPDAAPTRRGFFARVARFFVGSPLAVGFTSLGVTSFLWLLGCARFLFPNVLIEAPSRFKAGYPDGLMPGEVNTRYKSEHGVWIVCNEYEGQLQIYALRAVCTHLGCTPIWLDGEQKFKCPCHGSGFYKDGIHFEGPAPRPLERFGIRIANDGQLEVDKSRTFRRELGEWRDGASFVLV